MLVLSRKIGEVIHIGEDIIVTVVSVDGNKVRLGIQAPRTTAVLRGELLLKPTDAPLVAGLSVPSQE